MLDTDEPSLQLGMESFEREIDNGVGPSKQTMDRSLAAKMYIEQYYTTLLQNARERGDRYVIDVNLFPMLFRNYMVMAFNVARGSQGDTLTLSLTIILITIHNISSHSPPSFS